MGGHGSHPTQLNAPKKITLRPEAYRHLPTVPGHRDVIRITQDGRGDTKTVTGRHVDVIRIVTHTNDDLDLIQDGVASPRMLLQAVSTLTRQGRNQNSIMPDGLNLAGYRISI